MSDTNTRKRSLGPWTLIALVAGNMIGSGIFLLPSALSAIGTISIVAWVITAVGAILLALVFARLGGIMPRTGGPYAYCYEAYGDFMGFQVAYNYWIALWIGNAAIVVAFIGYLSVFWPALNHDPRLAFTVSVATVWLVTLINIVGVKHAGQVQLVTFILKLVPLAVMALVGLFFIHTSNLGEFNISGKSNMSALTFAATLTLWSFIGFESATVPAGDVIDPKRNIPRATIIGTLIAAVVYIVSTIAIMGVVKPEILAKSSAPFAVAATAIFGHWGGIAIAIVAVIATFGTLNGWVLMQGQIPFAAARDGLFPKAFGKLTPMGTPAVGLIVSSVLITGLLALRYGASLVNQFTFIILLAVLASLIPYILTAGAELLIYIKEPEKFSRKRLIRSSILASLAFIYAFWTIIGAGPETVYYGMILFFTGIPVYIWQKAATRRQQDLQATELDN